MQRPASTLRAASARRIAAWLVVVLAAIAPLAAGAQDVAPAPARALPEEDHSVETIAEASRNLGLGQRFSSCHAVTMRDEIVLCGHRAPDPRYAPLDAPRAPDAKALALGAPPVGHGVGVGATMRGCFLQKCPKDFYIIDLAAIPVAAPGSDADKISKGEMPAR